MLFEAPLAAGLLGNFVHAVSGGSLYRKSSFLLDSLGKQVFPQPCRSASGPHLTAASAARRSTSEGVATRDRDVVKDGVLQGYFLSAYSARKLGMQTTGNAGGSHNLIARSRASAIFAGLLQENGHAACWSPNCSARAPTM